MERSTSRVHPRGYSVAIAALMLTALFAISVPAAPITLTVPYVASPVADPDLDGDPSTGAWSDAVSYILSLENGRTDGYGSARLYAKHDGTNVYVRVDGQIDVPWASPAGDHFWFGMLFSPTRNGHHQSGQDSVFFGETNLGASIPILPVDANGGGKPPSEDAQQDVVGEMRATGSAAPYDFTAEWSRKLDTGDARDLVFLADGTTPYYFYASTDSDGGGSGGGSISHKVTTNDNVIRFAAPPGADVAPPTVSMTSPSDGATVSQTVLLSASATDDVGVTAVTFVLDGTTLAVDSTPPYEYAWSLAGVANGTHTVRAEARDAAGHVASDQITVTVSGSAPDRTAPAAPRGLLVRPSGPGAVLLVWTPGGDADLYGYFVFRLNDQGDPVQLNAEPARDPTYQDSGLVPGRAYAYVVRAVDLAGNLSPASPEASGPAGTPGLDLGGLGWVMAPLLAALLYVLLARAVLRGRREKRAGDGRPGGGSR